MHKHNIEHCALHRNAHHIQLHCTIGWCLLTSLMHNYKIEHRNAHRIQLHCTIGWCLLTCLMHTLNIEHRNAHCIQLKNQLVPSDPSDGSAAPTCQTAAALHSTTNHHSKLLRLHTMRWTTVEIKSTMPRSAQWREVFNGRVSLAGLDAVLPLSLLLLSAK